MALFLCVSSYVYGKFCWAALCWPLPLAVVPTQQDIPPFTDWNRAMVAISPTTKEPVPMPPNNTPALPPLAQNPSNLLESLEQLAFSIKVLLQSYTAYGNELVAEAAKKAPQNGNIMGLMGQQSHG